MYTVGSTVSKAVDNVFFFIITISVILLLVVTFLMIYFTVKYSLKKHPQPQPVKKRTWSPEATWML
jgi:heme/copper-type cytochrome/quinol oxidase subunit 2